MPTGILLQSPHFHGGLIRQRLVRDHQSAWDRAEPGLLGCAVHSPVPGLQARGNVMGLPGQKAPEGRDGAPGVQQSRAQGCWLQEGIKDDAGHLGMKRVSPDGERSGQWSVLF